MYLQTFGRCRFSHILYLCIRQKIKACIQIRADFDDFFCQRVQKPQADSAKLLICQPVSKGKGLRCLGSVLGIAQDRKSEMGAMNPKLVGASGQGVQLQPGNLPPVWSRRYWVRASFPSSRMQRKRLGGAFLAIGASKIPQGAGGVPKTAA